MQRFEQVLKPSQKSALLPHCSYSELYQQALAIATQLNQQLLKQPNRNVGILCSYNAHFVAALWGCWLADATAVPLFLNNPPEFTSKLLKSVDCEILLHNAEHDLPQGFQVIDITKLSCAQNLPSQKTNENALILFTSGTTSFPKGVVLTHANLLFHTQVLTKAWHWQASDTILSVLPWHHAHGLVNVLLCALRSQATVVPAWPAKPMEIWQHFLSNNLSLFMAVPTVYQKLLNSWPQLAPNQQEQLKEKFRNFRLMVSGSAPLPEDLFLAWEKLTGYSLLERYGMTEIGMAFSNPYHGERIAGTVGMALPGVQAKLEGDELFIKGPNVFKEYWNNPTATQESFLDGWFKTGDQAVYQEGYLKLLGRTSQDIIKCGGYKLSALEIETVLRQHPLVQDCAVCGLSDAELGEAPAAALVVEQGFSEAELQTWLQEKIPKYKIPRVFQQVEELPRNAMGKVQKKLLSFKQ